MCVFAIPYMMSLNSEPSTASLIAGGIIWLICLAAFIEMGYITFYQKEEVVNPLMSIQFWRKVEADYDNPELCSLCNSTIFYDVWDNASKEHKLQLSGLAQQFLSENERFYYWQVDYKLVHLFIYTMDWILSEEDRIAAFNMIRDEFLTWIINYLSKK
ncbi:MAG: hypothetical protein BWX61_00031 [Bacteroidetes bacterium ADurb.Bin035]|nr:MAG: hypothetical protein BWX61_00031 [Bacteroidetes bacterium ADurb.Bin035]